MTGISSQRLMLSKASFDRLIAILFVRGAVEILVPSMQSIMKRLQLSHWVQIGLGCLLEEECNSGLSSMCRVTRGGGQIPFDDPCSCLQELPAAWTCPQEVSLHEGVKARWQVQALGYGPPGWDLAMLCVTFGSESGAAVGPSLRTDWSPLFSAHISCQATYLGEAARLTGPGREELLFPPPFRSQDTATPTPTPTPIPLPDAREQDAPGCFLCYCNNQVQHLVLWTMNETERARSYLFVYYFSQSKR